MEGLTFSPVSAEINFFSSIRGLSPWAFLADLTLLPRNECQGLFASDSNVLSHWPAAALGAPSAKSEPLQCWPLTGPEAVPKPLACCPLRQACPLISRRTGLQG